MFSLRGTTACSTCALELNRKRLSFRPTSSNRVVDRFVRCQTTIFGLVWSAVIEAITTAPILLKFFLKLRAQNRENIFARQFSSVEAWCELDRFHTNRRQEKRSNRQIFARDVVAVHRCARQPWEHRSVVISTLEKASCEWCGIERESADVVPEEVVP